MSRPASSTSASAVGRRFGITERQVRTLGGGLAVLAMNEERRTIALLKMPRPNRQRYATPEWLRNAGGSAQRRAFRREYVRLVTQMMIDRGLIKPAGGVWFYA